MLLGFQQRGQLTPGSSPEAVALYRLYKVTTPNYQSN
jgi:hypothetical protein